MNIVPSKSADSVSEDFHGDPYADMPEKQMILRFVPIGAVSTRCKTGREDIVGRLTSTAGGVIAIGDILSKIEIVIDREGEKSRE